ncbi:MAG: glycosyl transferase [Planctomycetota bacterium]|nr:MAG: glycosyl transferase [Planctomycetota bacterium]
MSETAIVVIGRNEGQRLIACFDSLRGREPYLVYVDSGSSDGSIDAALSRGIDVITLDTDSPFTAARARNSGWRRSVERHPELKYVQFVDGDCCVDPDWISFAHNHLKNHPKLAAVAGRRRERHPEASRYNLLCDMEWDTPIGEAAAVGGDAMFRIAALQEADGFNDQLICGEEPELCFRLRQRGWSMERLDHEMTLHDADMHRFGQWWNRSKRGGWAFAEGAAMYGDSEERYNVQQYRSIWIWAALLPSTLLILGGLVTGFVFQSFFAAAIGAVLSPLLLMPLALWLNSWRVARNRVQRHGDSWRSAKTYAFWALLWKYPAFLGLLSFAQHRRSNRKASLIEYK